MAAGDRAQNQDSVDQAVNRVLAAEREARDAVERSRAEAAQVLSAAEEGARRIARRTEHRIKLAHRIADRAVERALAELRDRKSAAGPTLAEADVGDLLDRAVDALVDEILGGQP